jgi:hypothetical protein
MPSYSYILGGLPDTKTMARNFTTGSYYWMWPFKDSAYLRLGDILRRVVNNEILYDTHKMQKFVLECKKFYEEIIKRWNILKKKK